jgi:dynein heavy chain
MEPILKQKTIDQEVLIKKLDVDKVEANKKKIFVQDEESIVLEKAEEIRVINEKSQEQLAEARPKLEEAVEALNLLNRSDTSELKTARLEPGSLMLDLMQCVQIIFDKGIDDKSIKKTLADTNFLKELKDAEPKNIQKATIDRLKAKKGQCPNLTIANMKNATHAGVSILKWVNAIVDSADIFETVQKLEHQAGQIQIVYDKQMGELKSKQDEVAEIMAKVKELETLYFDNKVEKERLDSEIEATYEKLSNADKLSKGLADEQVRWKETVEILSESKDKLLGDIFLSSASIAYHGPFTDKFRNHLFSIWKENMTDVLEIEFSPNFSMETTIVDPSIVREWNAKGLPSNSASISNGILMKRSCSYPYLIDPQLQGNTWIKNMEAENQLKCVKANDEVNLMKQVEMALRNTFPIIIEDALDTLPAGLDPILLKQYEMVGGRKNIKLGDNLIELEDDFMIWFSTKLSNPEFLPEVFIRVAVINFTVNESGLEEQLLAEVIQKIMPEIEETKNMLIMSIAEDKASLKRGEDKILQLLSDSTGDILEDKELISNLEISKIKSESVKEKLIESESTQATITESRNKYQPVAARGSLMYFVVVELSHIDPMYQFSLTYYIRLFRNIIESSEKPEEVAECCRIFITNITTGIFRNVCRGLFNDHKKIFSFLLGSGIAKKEGDIKLPEWEIFLKGIPVGASLPNMIKMPNEFRINENNWKSLNYLAGINDVVKKFLDD